MTVSYQYDVASSASGGFIRLLFRWRGSVWKVVYREMVIFTVCYIFLSLLYKFAMNDGQMRVFESIVHFCSTFMDLIPLSFMLGFYVSFIAARWWSQFIAIPWPDKLMNIVAMYIPGLDEASRVVRRTLMRYLNLSLVLVLRSISMAVKRRFPTKEHLVEAGFMTKTELEMFQSVPSTEFNTFWIPCTWFINVLREARQECRITDSNGLKLIMEELNEFRSKCGLLWGYDWISIPLVYTQVVTMATYAFFVLCIFGRQPVNSNEGHMKYHRYDYYIPIFTILQLMFYMGLLKVAEQLINPFGDDDEDFELNWIIDRHMKVSYLGVDTLNGTPPPLVKDSYYNELDVKIPYTEASRNYKKKTYRGSVAYMQVPIKEQGMVLPDMSEEEDDGETQSEHHMGPRRPSMYNVFGNKGSNHRGASPSSSVINLDSESLDSEWKGSLPNVSTAGAKNASGTLGSQQRHPYHVEMSTAEDDEIVLDEVVIDPIRLNSEALPRQDSLKIPGKPPDHRPHTLANALRQISPKIAPKFTREKLKSMLRKGKKMAMDHPIFRMKAVTFSRETKCDDDEEDDIERSASLLDVQDPQEVKITLSTPELTETEKLMGVYPYQFIQQRTPSPSGFGDSLFQPSNRAPPWSGPHFSPSSTEETIQTEEFPLMRSLSLPNISRCTIERFKIEDFISAQLKKKLQSSGKVPKKEKKRHKRKKSPPPPPLGGLDLELPSDIQSDQEFSDISTSSPRRNTLPQITVTRCNHKSPNHLDLAVTPPSSRPSSNHSSDSGGSSSVHQSRPAFADSSGMFLAQDRSRSRSRLSKESLPSSECSSVGSKGAKVRTTTSDRPLFPKAKMLPQSRSKEFISAHPPKRPKSLKPQSKPHVYIPAPGDTPFLKDQPATAPTKPSTLASSQFFPTDKLQKSESLPGTPTSDIPSIPSASGSPSFPDNRQRTSGSPRDSPVPSTSRESRISDSIQGPAARDEPSSSDLTSVVVTDPRKDSVAEETQKQQRPNLPPRPAPRRGSRGRK